MFGMFGGFGLGGGSFDSNYRAYPVSFIDKGDAEHADKVFLPPSALDRLASLNIEYPMLFKVENRKTGRSTHCGVLEFIADEGHVYLPYWMMQNLALEEGEIVNLKSASLPKGTYVKLQPHTTDFIDITNPKAVLETTLRNFSCLTVGDQITINYNNRQYFIDIVEAKPQAAISVIETDCEVDFAPPLDYVEPTRSEPTPAPVQEQPAESTSEPEVAEPSFVPFRGAAQRLDGKAPSPSTGPPAPSTSAASGSRSSSGAAAPGRPPSSNGAAPAAPKQKAGKVISAGGNRLAAKQAAAKEQKAPAPPKEPAKPDAPKFSAFQGKGHSLKG
ncbi:hypothetical protein ABBQ32_006864 [Trebouxia sp. C0010 RCD-2024]